MTRMTSDAADNASASQRIDAKIAALGDWRGETLARIRKIIHQADPEVIETVKWGRVPVWEHAGILTTGETYKTAVKMTFAKGASLADPSGLFNSSLDGNTRRAIDFHQGDTIDEEALKALIRAAVALNTSKGV
ncbi:DUF1801 domain-containing protein [Brevundimonas sp. LjRoot202]|uniref:DUF1801 domain-containing protein n=1 Tax=Brevundimonas sp. LjRoot202 TaxID=3342281 RepID=UPI003ECEDD68